MVSWDELDRRIQAIYDAAMPRQRLMLSQARSIWPKRDKVWPHNKGGALLTYREVWEIRWRTNYDAFVTQQKDLRANELRRSVQGNAATPGSPVSGGDSTP